MERWRHPFLALGLLILLGGTLRWAVAEAVAPMRLLGDEWYYVRVAEQIAKGEGHRAGDSLALRPPAHAYALSLFIDPAHPRARPSITAMQRSQIALGMLLVVLTWLLGRSLFDARTGLAAAAITAGYPAFVFLAHGLWSENLFTVLVTAGLAGIASLRLRFHWGLAALTGVVFGAATLTREIAFGVAGLGLLWWVATASHGERTRAWRGSALVLACAIVVVLPWTFRNQSVLGRAVPVSTIGWFSAAEGNTLPSPDWLAVRGREHGEFKKRYLEIPGELRRARFARAWSLEKIREEQPAWLPKKLARTWLLLYGPDSVVFEKLRSQRYPELSVTAARASAAAAFAAWALALAAGVLGIAAAPDRARRWLPLLVFGGVSAVHVLTNATARFRVPWLPLLFVYAAYALLHAREVRESLARPAGKAALALIALWILTAAPYFFVYQDPDAVWSADRSQVPSPGSTRTSASIPAGRDR